MSQRSSLLRSLNDVGLAAWFGGSLAGAVAINGALQPAPGPVLDPTGPVVGNAKWPEASSRRR